MSTPSSSKPTPKIGKAVVDALARGVPNVELSKLPNLTNLSAETLCENVIAINSLCENARLKFVMEKLVTHLHAFANEVSLTTEEWMGAIEFLTSTGKICSDIRQEFILLSDILGLSALVDAMTHPKPEGATEATVLGPFFTEDAHDVPAGGSICSEGKGEYMLVSGRVTDLQGKGIEGCTIETWETDDEGLYDTQYEDRAGPDCRGRLTTDSTGYYVYRAVKPVAYPIPSDGPVGGLLRQLNRHVFRPAHLHMMLDAKGYTPLTTALYFTGDFYLKSDAVFGVNHLLSRNSSTRQTNPRLWRTVSQEFRLPMLWRETLCSLQQKSRHSSWRRSGQARTDIVDAIPQCTCSNNNHSLGADFWRSAHSLLSCVRTIFLLGLPFAFSKLEVRPPVETVSVSRCQTTYRRVSKAKLTPVKVSLVKPDAPSSVECGH